MEVSQLRQKFLDHFSRLGYQLQPASSVVPVHDPSVLFTTAGMQQFKPFYTHPQDAPSEKVATIQPVIRTTDIAEVGDDTHLTQFEMLGIFSFGQPDSYALKKDAITAMWQFITQEVGVAKQRVYVTIFAGDELTPRDDESDRVWRELGVEVREMGRADNFWGPTGTEGPCGPNTEIYVDDVEIGNLVFNEYYRAADGQFSKLEQFGLDFGAGLERLSATLQNEVSVWTIEPFRAWMESVDAVQPRDARIIIDHLKAAAFLISAGIQPANKGREYVLRRLIRKAVFLAASLPNRFDWETAASFIVDFYSPYSLRPTEEILSVIYKEKEQFEKNLSRAASYLEKWLAAHPQANEKDITELAFYMYESFGFPKELVVEHLASLGAKVDVEHFEKLFTEHQEISRAGMAGQFVGGLADHEEPTIKHHTAHHLLLAAIQQVLGREVVQKGSNVTSERLRIDFNFDRKLTDEEIKKIEAIVNEKIEADLPVVRTEMKKDDALASGAQAEFGQKYGDTVSVYSIGDFSKELCGGPHVETTGQLGRFEIIKEEASSQGVRRIKARCQ